MEKNVGGYDRIARFVVGPLLLVVGLVGISGAFGTGTPGLALAGIALLVGAILSVTATTQKCPLNSTLGIDTCSSESSGSASGEASTPDPKMN
jgi:disulfide bond formation protein DsbB